MRRGDEGDVLFAGQRHDLIRNSHIPGDHQRAHAIQNGRPLCILAIAHHDHDVGLDAAVYALDRHRTDKDLVAQRSIVGLHEQPPAQRLNHVVHVQVDLVQPVILKTGEKDVGKILHADEACQSTVVVHHAHSADLTFAQTPSDTVHRLSGLAHDRPRIHDIHGMRAHIFD